MANPVDLANLNITLQQFNSIASGKYNAGIVNNISSALLFLRLCNARGGNNRSVSVTISLFHYFTHPCSLIPVRG